MMIFYSSFFYLLIVVNELVFTKDLIVRDECTVTLQLRESEHVECWNAACSAHKNPWMVFDSRGHQERICYFHYLKLAFTSYERFERLPTNQLASGKPLEDFFWRSSDRNGLLDIEIDDFYPSHINDDLISNTLLNLLGGKGETINLLHIRIEHWHFNYNSETRVFESKIMERQPFDEIVILFMCKIKNQWTKIILRKDLQEQEESPCPTQILVQRKSDTPVVRRVLFKGVQRQDEDRGSHQRSSIKSNIGSDKGHSSRYSSIKSDSEDDDDDEYIPRANHHWDFFAKTGIVFIVIASIIFCIVYQLICRRGQPSNNNTNIRN